MADTINTVKNVAQWFLSKESMTHKKLQKLCYYAQAWYCALYDGTPLFQDEIQAWAHGPVIVSLFFSFHDYKWEPIPKIENLDYSAYTPKELDIFEAVYNTYGGLTGDQLEWLTRSEFPWKNARGDLQPWESGTTVITCSAMRKYYAQKYEQNQND